MKKYIDADALIMKLADYALQEAPNENDDADIRMMDKAVYEAINECIKTVEEMPAADVELMESWISVDERLPEYKESQGAKAYWVAWKKRNGEFEMRLALYCDYGYAMEIEGIPTKVTWRDWDFHVVENVTHWMNLPEPPKMDGGSK